MLVAEAIGRTLANQGDARQTAAAQRTLPHVPLPTRYPGGPWLAFIRRLAATLVRQPTRAAVRPCRPSQDWLVPRNASSVAVTMASIPVSSVGWMTGANRGLWLVGMSSAMRPACSARR